MLIFDKDPGILSVLRKFLQIFTQPQKHRVQSYQKSQKILRILAKLLDIFKFPQIFKLGSSSINLLQYGYLQLVGLVFCMREPVLGTGFVCIGLQLSKFKIVCKLLLESRQKFVYYCVLTHNEVFLGMHNIFLVINFFNSDSTVCKFHLRICACLQLSPVFPCSTEVKITLL